MTLSMEVSRVYIIMEKLFFYNPPHVTKICFILEKSPQSSEGKMMHQRCFFKYLKVLELPLAYNMLFWGVGGKVTPVFNAMCSLGMHMLPLKRTCCFQSLSSV